MALSLPPRHSRAALRSAETGESARTVRIALLANVVIALAKLGAGLLSGSAAMLAEAAHSFADSLNEVLPGSSMPRANRPADRLHPIGFGRERFLWAFLAAIASFLIGGCLSIVLAIRNLHATGESTSQGIAWLVLAIAFIADGVSWWRGMRQARREAAAHDKGVWRYLWRTSDPVLRAVVVEDNAALLGLALAALGLLLSHWAGNDIPDALAALLIGVLLAVTAIGLGRILADYLVGRSLPPSQLEQLEAIVTGSPAVAEILTLWAVYIAPEEAIVAAKIHPDESLGSEQLAREMDALDGEIREALPEVADVFLDVTSFRRETLPSEALPSAKGAGAAAASL